MRNLTDATNVDAPNGDYPNGKVRDRNGTTPGTIYNEVLHGDLIQTIQKIIIEAGITPNSNPDNVSNGYQIYDAMRKSLKYYRSYIVRLTAQIGGQPPSAGVHVNEFDGVTFTWSRQGVGHYRVTASSNVFALNDRVMVIASSNINGTTTRIPVITSSSVSSTEWDLFTYDADTNTANDDILAFTHIEFKIFDS
ncbi:MAG: hypothetical protein ACPGSO_00655 [Vicingaceae bacterium]